MGRLFTEETAQAMLAEIKTKNTQLAQLTSGVTKTGDELTNFNGKAVEKLTKLEKRTHVLSTYEASRSIMSYRSLVNSKIFTQAELLEKLTSTHNYFGLYPGDFWYIDKDGVGYRCTILGFNYNFAGHTTFNNSVEGKLSGSHCNIMIQIVNDAEHVMWHNDATEHVALYNAYIRTAIMPKYQAIVEEFFGADHVIAHRVLIADSVGEDGTNNHWCVSAEKMFMFTEAQIWGYYHEKSSYQNLRKQFPYFKFHHLNLTGTAGHTWLDRPKGLYNGKQTIACYYGDHEKILDKTNSQPSTTKYGAVFHFIVQ